ncbi:hypothetical protein [Micromonospora vulcania]|uniref:Uncharacterized protein n=1 Tax=Micromonospora vulcania TaxID=1441873 RepID=A0ABW1H1C3_9ACTN
MRPIPGTDAQPVVASLPADLLPHGLPMFGVTLTVAALHAELQVFGVLGSRSVPRLVLHDVLVHPEQFDDLAVPAGTVALLQTHGRCWLLCPQRSAEPGEGGRVMDVRQVDGEAHFEVSLVRVGPDGDQIRLLDRHGTLLSKHELRGFRADDQEVVVLIGVALATQFDDEALSAVLARPYPGVTSLIRQPRPFPRLFPSDRVGSDGQVSEVWA